MKERGRENQCIVWGARFSIKLSDPEARQKIIEGLQDSTGYIWESELDRDNRFVMRPTVPIKKNDE